MTQEPGLVEGLARHEGNGSSRRDLGLDEISLSQAGCPHAFGR